MIEWTETLTTEQLELEKWMLSLRLSEGFPVNWLKTSPQKVKAQALETQGLLEQHPENPGDRFYF